MVCIIKHSDSMCFFFLRNVQSFNFINLFRDFGDCEVQYQAKMATSKKNRERKKHFDKFQDFLSPDAGINFSKFDTYAIFNEYKI